MDAQLPVLGDRYRYALGSNMKSVIRMSVACFLAACVGCSASSEADPVSEAAHTKAFSEGDVRDFLAIRSRTYGQLNKAIEVLPEGVELLLPGAHVMREQETHDETVARYREQMETGRGWYAEGGKNNLFSKNGYQLMLSIDYDTLPNGNDSESMLAAVLLKHFFDGLPEVGYKASDTPSIIGDVQHIRRKWYWGSNRKIVVNGSVFVAPCCSRAIVICEMRTRFPDGVH